MQADGDTSFDIEHLHSVLSAYIRDIEDMDR